MTGPAPAVEARGLRKHYGRIRALDGLDLDIPAGSVFGFLGPNGAGKTTTLRLLTGLGHPTAGSARVAGIDPTADAVALARQIGYLDQDPRFYGWMTGAELLEFGGRLHGLAGAALRARVAETLETVGLADAARRRVGGYSGGMRQRLGIGQAILHRPAVLFLDEPVSSLDPEGRRDVLEIVGRLRGTATVVLSTHILADVERVCDRVAILDHGRLVTEAPIDDLLERYARPIFELEPEAGQAAAVEALAAELRAAPWAASVTAEHGLLRVHARDERAAGGAILATVAKAGVRLARYERARPTLEDVFLLLVGSDRDGIGERAANGAGRAAGSDRTGAGEAVR